MAVTFINVELTHGHAQKVIFERRGYSIDMPITGFVFTRSGRLTLHSTDPTIANEIVGCLYLIGVDDPKVLTLGHTGDNQDQWSASFELACIDNVQLI